MPTSGDQTGTVSSFDPLSMIEMWQDLHQLIEQWSEKYETTPDLAATALREFAESLSNRPPTYWDKRSIEWLLHKTQIRSDLEFFTINPTRQYLFSAQHGGCCNHKSHRNRTRGSLQDIHPFIYYYLYIIAMDRRKIYSSRRHGYNEREKTESINQKRVCKEQETIGAMKSCCSTRSTKDRQNSRCIKRINQGWRIN